MLIECECGCGGTFQRREITTGRWKRFIPGHNLPSKGWKMPEETKVKITSTMTGKQFTPEHKANIKKAAKTRKKPPPFTKEHRRNLSKAHKGRKLSEEAKRKRSARRGHLSGGWKGGYSTKGIPAYDTYAQKIAFAEKVRRDPGDSNILQVTCAYCGKFFTPKIQHVEGRVMGFNNLNQGENRFYCSEACKHECPIYHVHNWPKDFKIGTGREVQPELRQMVFERDNWECQKCGEKEPLHCHHFEGVLHNPIESADVDACITLCKPCHQFAHSQKGCRPVDLACK